MANELENAVKNAGEKIAKALQDASEMTIETLYVEIGADGSVDFSSAIPAAQTKIEIDGDSRTIIPMRRTDGGSLEVDTPLLDIHQNNVTTAIEYRSQILNALLSILQPRSK